MKKHTLLPIVFALCTVFINYTAHAQQWQQLGQDIDGEAAYDESGYSVSLSSDGSRVAIGADRNVGNGNSAGHVRIYDWNGSSWVQVGQDIDGEAAGDWSGSSVSLSSDGSRVAIGARYNDGNGSNAGHVRIYDWNGSSWVQVGQDIDGEAAGDYSGWSVSLSSDGSRVAIGAPENDGNGSNAGHVRIYDWNGSSWVQVGQDIDGEARSDISGWSVSLSSDGSRVAIGAPNNDGNGIRAGHVRIYDWNGSSWVQVGQDIDGEAAEDESGCSVSLSSDGSRVAIGAPFNDGNGSNAGHVRIYDWNGSSWVQVGQDIDGEARSDISGWSVSLSSDGSRVAIGAPNNDGNGIRAGHVRIYDWNGSSWVQVGQDIDGEAAEDESGCSVSLSSDGSRVAIGAPFNDGNGSNAGHTRLYSFCNDMYGNDSVVACDTYTSPSGNNNWTSSGVYVDTITLANGCDSIITINLTINSSNTGTDVQTACDSYTWIDGNTYTSSTNTPSWTLTNASGCDSIVTLDLTINNSNSGTDVQTACDSYTWIDGNTYASSTSTPTWTLSNAAGCDSVVTLDLTINSSNTGTDVQTACDSYTWIDGNTYTSSTNTPSWSLTNASGCDSIVTLDLTINNSNSGTDVQTACDSYTWIDGNTYASSTSTPTWTLSNASGCDSIVTLDLTINNSNSGTDVQSACDSYTWIDGQTYTSSTSTPTWTLSNAAGCDSVVTLDLTINNSNSGTDVQTACDSYTWIDGNTYTSSTSTPTWTLSNAAGCDSVVTLDLTIDSINDNTASLSDSSLFANDSSASYQWLDCNANYSLITGETNQEFAPNASGTYAVEITSNGCVDTSECIVFQMASVGVSESTFPTTISAYPNPFQRDLTVELGGNYSSITMRVYDILGKEVYGEDFYDTSILNAALDLPSGTYSIIISDDAGREAELKVTVNQ